VENKNSDIAISDAGSSLILCRVSAGEQKIDWDGVRVSADKQRLLACFEDNQLAVWTRTRQHFEWWGLFERPELWLAVALFAAFCWGIRRDWTTT